MQRTDLPVRFQIPFANGASAPFIRDVPVPSQISFQAGAASLTDGYPPACFLPIGAGGTPFWGADVNGITNQITKWSRWQAAGGPVPWDSTFNSAIAGYPNGAIIASDTAGYAWLCTADDNTVNPNTGSPDVPASGWLPIALKGGSLTTGSWTWRPTAEILPGWIKANGTTIGNGASGATQLASEEARACYGWHWRQFSNSQCPVSGGRGANANADFDAGKTLTVLSLRGVSIIGMDTMGGGATTNLSGVPVTSGSATSPGSYLGENLHSLNANENGPHSHTYSYYFGNQAGTPGGNSLMTFATSGTTSTSGLGTAHNTVELTMTGTMYFKL